MLSQEALSDGVPLSFPLLEEHDSPEAIEGDTRTHNVPANQSQRKIMTYRYVTSDFSVSIQMPLCVHAWENAEKRQVLSLMVFDYNLEVTELNWRPTLCLPQPVMISKPVVQVQYTLTFTSYILLPPSYSFQLHRSLHRSDLQNMWSRRFSVQFRDI